MSFDGTVALVQPSCILCKNSWTFGVQQQKWFMDKNLKNIPKRCNSCCKKRSVQQRADGAAPHQGKKVFTEPTSNRRPRLAMGIVDLISSRPVHVLLTVEGVEHTIPESPLTASLSPGMVVGVGFSLSGNISSIVPIEDPETLPPLRGFVRGIDSTKKMLIVKVRASADTIWVSYPNSSPPPTILSTILIEPTMDDDTVIGGSLMRILSQKSLGSKKRDVITPTTMTFLSSTLGIDSDLSSNSMFSTVQAPQDFIDFKAKPNFLPMEEAIISTPELLEEDNQEHLWDILDKGLRPVLLTSETSAGMLIPVLKKWCEELERQGLERVITVLYPTRRSTTPLNILNTVATKLLDNTIFPYLSHTHVLTEPIEVLGVDDRGNPLGTQFIHVAPFGKSGTLKQHRRETGKLLMCYSRVLITLPTIRMCRAACV